MKRTFKTLAVLLAAIMLLASIPLSASAFGTTDMRMAVNFINTSNTTEGSSIVLSPTVGNTVGAFGNFAWWSVYVFDWDAADGCYKVTTINRNANNVDKSAMKIPDTGFALGMCKGNNYPALGMSGENYVSQMIVDTIAAASKLKVGDKVYLYNINLKKGYIKTNGAKWYSSEYVTDSYIKIGEPDADGTPYDPNNVSEEKPAYTLTPTAVDNKAYASGECIVFTPNYGDSILKANETQALFDWWKVVVCDYDASEACYKIISVNQTQANSTPKFAVIPANGFVIADCNSAGGANISSFAAGDKVYLYGVDLSAGTKTASAKILFNQPDDKLAAYAPKLQSPLASPVVTNMTEKKTLCTKDGFTVTWNAVEGATGYRVFVNSSDIVPDGTLPVRETVSGTSYTIPASLLSEGKSYTVSVWAEANGRTSSAVVRKLLYCVAESSYNSTLGNKTVVAFGDSLTARPGWVGMLGGYIGTEVINAGVGGDSTRNARIRLQSVLDLKPDVTVICFGMNDQAVVITDNKSNVPLDIYTDNMAYCIKELQAIGSEIVLVTPNPVCTEAGYYKAGSYNLDYGRTEVMHSYCAAICRLAHDYGCALVDMNTEFTAVYGTDLYNYGDGIHQSPEGHELFAKCIGNALNAIYNDLNKAVVTVNCEDDAGALESFELVGAVGAKLNYYAPEFDEITLNKTKSKEMNEIVFGTTSEISLVYDGHKYAIEFVDGGFTSASGNFIYVNKYGVTEEAFMSQTVSEGVTVTGVIGTGATVKLKGRTDDYTVVVKGDIDGDGVITAVDYLYVKRMFLGTIKTTDAQRKAAEITTAGSVTAIDYLKIKRQLLGISDIFSAK